MLTWFTIGVIVQLAIIIERAIRVPDYWSMVDFKDWRTYAALLYSMTVNVMAWPAAIVMEIWMIVNGL